MARRGRLILIIDPDLDFVEDTRMLLDGERTLTARSLEEAEEIAEGGRLDAAVLGPSFGNEAGVRASGRLLAIDPTIRLVLAANVVTNRVLLAALQSGLADVVDTPLTVRKLATALAAPSRAAAGSRVLDVVVEAAPAAAMVAPAPIPVPVPVPVPAAVAPPLMVEPVMATSPVAMPVPVVVPVLEPVVAVAPIPAPGPLPVPVTAVPPVAAEPAPVALEVAPVLEPVVAVASVPALAEPIAVPVAAPESPDPVAEELPPMPVRLPPMPPAAQPLPPPFPPPPRVMPPALEPEPEPEFATPEPSLRPAISRPEHSPDSEEPRPAGERQVIVVMAGKGGSGKSVVATNLAMALTFAAGEDSVAIVDADLQFGDVALLLQMDPVRNLAEVARQVEDLSEARLDALLLRHESGLRVLPAPLQPAAADSVSPKAVVQVVEKLRRLYPFVVVDTGGILDDTLLTLLDHADEVIVVVDMDLPSVKNAKVALDILRSGGYAMDRLRLVVNRINSKARLDLVELERSLGLRTAAALPSDRLVPQSVNEGVPVVALSPRSRVARAFTQLAKQFLPGGGRKGS